MQNLLFGTIQSENLIAIAKKPDRKSRKRLLEELTELFIIASHNLTEHQRYSLGEILYFIAVDLGVAEKRKLAEHLAATKHAPHFLVNSLARESIEVATPLLEYSPVLSEKDLIHIALTKEQDHLTAIAARNDLGRELIGIILSRGNDEAVTRLKKNQSVKNIDWFRSIRHKLQSKSA